MHSFIKTFEAEVKQHPNNVAVKYHNNDEEFLSDITFAELNDRVNQLAHYLKHNYNIVTGSCVGILRERSLDTLLMMLVVWKLNASYILLDPQQIKTHNDLLKSYIRKCKVALIATQKKESEFFRGLDKDIKIFCFDNMDVSHEINLCSRENLIREDSEDVVAYYIPTSGSSGDPKICTILQGSGLTDLFEDIGTKLTLGNGDTVLWNAPLSFDPIIAIIGWSFYKGAAIYIPSSQGAQDMELLMTVCEAAQVNVMLVLPTLIPRLMEHAEKLKKIANLRILSTGESLSLEHVQILSKIATGGVWNGYGPSEAPIGISMTRNNPTDVAINIGEPIKGRRFKIINSLTEQEQSEGKEGELCYQGQGFGGYLGEPDETAKRKIIINGEQWWRSGDFVCWEIKNNTRYLAFRGRNDEQIKIAGVRIELTGIETILSRHPSVERVRTIYMENEKKHKLGRIISYCEAKDESLVVEELTAYLRSHISRLICHSVVILASNDQLSLHHTANGKIDKKKLFTQYHSKIFSAENQSLQETLSTIWRDLLGVKDIQPSSNFLDLGGSSMDFITLEALVTENDNIKIKNFSSSFRREFYRDPCFANFHLLITQHNDRAMRIQRFHQEREAKPLIFFGENAIEELGQICDMHPIIQINLNSPLTLPQAERCDLEELNNIVKICDPFGPYLLCTTSKHNDLIKSLVEKLQATNTQVMFFGISNASCFMKNLSSVYSQYLSRRIDETIQRIRNRLALSAVTGSFNESIQAGEAFCFFGAAATGKTNTALVFQKQICQNPGVYLPVYLDKKSNPNLAIDAALLNMGFSVEEVPLVTNKSLIFIVDGITRLEEIEELFDQSLFAKCSEKRCLFTVNPTMISHDKFINFLRLKFPICKSVHLTKNYFFENKCAADMPEFFSTQIDEIQKNASEIEKAQHYDRWFHYALTLANSMQVSQNSEGLSQRLLDIQDKLTHQALIACPVIVQDGKPQFINSELKQYFLQYSLEKKNWPNPYKNHNAMTINVLLQLKQIVKIYNEKNGSGSQALFFFPPITGQEVLSSLIQYFPENQLVYSFSHPQLTEIGSEFPSISALAQFYLQFITLLCPNGPIALAGWSFGGNLCHEVAKQLISLGREINYLAIIDSPSPTFYQVLLKNPQQHAELLLSRLNWLIQTYQLNGQFAFKEIRNIDEADQMFSQLEEQNKAKSEEVKLIMHICRKHYRQLFDIAGDAQMISVARLYQATDSDPFYTHITMSALGWEVDESRVHFIQDSNHFTITQGEVAIELARKIQCDFEETLHERSNRYFDASMTAVVRSALQSCRALSPNNYIPLKLKGLNVDDENVDEFWRKSIAKGFSDNYLLLGESGSGKSSSLRRLFELLAAEYLQAPREKPIPVIIKLRDFREDAIINYLRLSGLNRAEEWYLFQQHIIFIIDGIDEVDYQSFVKSLQLLSTIKAKWFFSCKSNYFEHNHSLQSFLIRNFKVKRIHLQPLDKTQQEVFLRDSAVDKDLVGDMLGNGEALTPNLLKLLVRFTYNVKLRRCNLYKQWLITQVERKALDFDKVYRFVKDLAIFNFGLDRSLKKNAIYPWETECYNIESLLNFPRYDTDKLVSALDLQITMTGFDFSHRSFLDYFMSRVIFEQIINESLPISAWYINKISLYYEHDLLSFINDAYQEYLISTPEDGAARRIFQQRLHSCVAAAKNNPEKSLLAANALSILAACKDFYLCFPDNYQNVFLDNVNLSNSNISNQDFTGVIAEEAILVGAITHHAKLPRHWQRSTLEKSYLIRTLFTYNDGSVWGDFHQNKPRISDLNAWQRICLSDTSRLPIAIAPLLINKDQEDHPANIIDSIIYHPNGKHYAVLSKYPDKSYRKDDSIARGGLVHLQLFSEKKIIADYTFDYEKKPKIYSFHPSKILLFMLSRFRGFSGQCSDLLIYDPERDEPSLIPLVNSVLQSFSFNTALSIFICDSIYFEFLDTNSETWFALPPDAKSRDKIRETRGILLIDLNNEYQRTFVSLSKLVGKKDDELKMSITACAAFHSHPYVAVAVNDSNGNNLYVYHFQKDRVIAKLAIGNRKVTQLGVDNEGNGVIYAVHKFVYHWDIFTDKVIALFESMGEVSKLISNQDFFVLNVNLKLQIIPRQILREVNKQHIGHKNLITKILEHPTLPMIISLGHEDQIIAWDTRNGELLWRIEPVECNGLAACFSPDGKYFFLGVNASVWIHVIGPSTCKLEKILPGDILSRLQKCISKDEHLEERFFGIIENILVDPNNNDILIISTQTHFGSQYGHELFRWNWKNGALEEIEQINDKKNIIDPLKYSTRCLSASQLNGEIWLAQETTPSRFYILGLDDFTLVNEKSNNSHHIRELIHSRSSNIMLAISKVTTSYMLHVFSRMEDKTYKLLVQFKEVVHAAFSADETYLAILISDGYKAKDKSHILIWKTSTLMEMPDSTPLQAIPIFEGKLGTELCWTRENKLFVGTLEADLFCYDMEPLKHGLTPNLKWSSAQNTQYASTTVSTGRFFKACLNNTVINIIKYDISFEESLSLLGLTEKQAFDLLITNLVAIRDSLQPIVLRALEDRILIKKDFVHQFCLFGPKNQPGYSHNLNIIMDYIVMEFTQKNSQAHFIHPTLFLALANLKGIAVQFWQEDNEKLQRLNDKFDDESVVKPLNFLLTPNGYYTKLEFNHRAFLPEMTL